LLFAVIDLSTFLFISYERFSKSSEEFATGAALSGGLARGRPGGADDLSDRGVQPVADLSEIVRAQDVCAGPQRARIRRRVAVEQSDRLVEAIPRPRTPEKIV